MAFGQLRQRENFWLSCLRCFGLSINLRLHPPRRFRASADTRKLILDGLLSDFVRFRACALRRDVVGTCVCLHALSSFQRTDPLTATFAAGLPQHFLKGTF